MMDMTMAMAMAMMMEKEKRTKLARVVLFVNQASSFGNRLAYLRCTAYLRNVFIGCQ